MEAIVIANKWIVSELRPAKSIDGVAIVPIMVAVEFDPELCKRERNSMMFATIIWNVPKGPENGILVITERSRLVINAGGRSRVEASMIRLFCKRRVQTVIFPDVNTFPPRP